MSSKPSKIYSVSGVSEYNLSAIRCSMKYLCFCARMDRDTLAKSPVFLLKWGSSILCTFFSIILFFLLFYYPYLLMKRKQRRRRRKASCDQGASNHSCLLKQQQYTAWFQLSRWAFQTLTDTEQSCTIKVQKVLIKPRNNWLENVVSWSDGDLYPCYLVKL